MVCIQQSVKVEEQYNFKERYMTCIHLLVKQGLGLTTAAIDVVLGRATHNLEVVDRPRCLACVGHGVLEVLLPRGVKKRVLVDARFEKRVDVGNSLLVLGRRHAALVAHELVAVILERVERSANLDKVGPLSEQLVALVHQQRVRQRHVKRLDPQLDREQLALHRVVDLAKGAHHSVGHLQHQAGLVGTGRRNRLKVAKQLALLVKRQPVASLANNEVGTVGDAALDQPTRSLHCTLVNQGLELVGVGSRVDVARASQPCDGNGCAVGSDNVDPRPVQCHQPHALDQARLQGGGLVTSHLDPAVLHRVAVDPRVVWVRCVPSKQKQLRGLRWVKGRVWKKT
jgi:hypothetical protein